MIEKATILTKKCSLVSPRQVTYKMGKKHRFLFMLSTNWFWLKSYQLRCMYGEVIHRVW